MRPPIIIGVVIAAVILIAAFLAPQFRSGASKAAEQAREQAALAERLLHRYDYHLPQLDRFTDTANIEFEQAATREQYQALLSTNADRLDQAAQTAKQARGGEGSSVVGVSHISGMAEYTRAVGQFAEAQVHRQQQQRLQARLLMLGARWKAYRTYQDYLTGLDVRDMLVALRRDLDEIRQLGTEAAAQADSLTAEVAGREQALARVEQQLQQARTELLTLEQQGFTAGNDDSFNAYREKYTVLCQRLRKLEEEEQLLRSGGRREARFVGDDLLSAEIEGDEPAGRLAPLEQLKRQLATANEKAVRLSKGLESLEQHLTFVEQSGRAAKQDEGTYVGLQDDLRDKIGIIIPLNVSRQGIVEPLFAYDEVSPLLNEAEKKAREKENEALKAVRDAVGAFNESQQAAEAWVRDAQQVQREKDPERKNPRLQRIVNDTTTPRIGASAKAAALVLTARIHAQRIEANQSLVDDMNMLVELLVGMDPAPPFDPASFEEEIPTARDNALDALNSATEIYNDLARQPSNTQWIPQAGLAAVYHLLARVELDAAESARYLTSAFETAQQAVAGREKSPYLHRHVQFRNLLREKTGLGVEEPVEPAEDEGLEEEGEPGEEG